MKKTIDLSAREFQLVQTALTECAGIYEAAIGGSRCEKEARRMRKLARNLFDREFKARPTIDPFKVRRSRKK